MIDYRGEIPVKKLDLHDISILPYNIVWDRFKYVYLVKFLL